MTKNEIEILLVKLFISIVYIADFLVTKPVGILFLSIGLYYFSSSLGFDEPFNFSELMQWLDQLPENSKTTVFTSIVTIFGFLIAFSINSTIQKQHLMSQMRMEASNDIESFFNEVSRNITSANIYAKYLIEIANHINNGADKATIEFHLQNVIIETEDYELIRKTLQKQAIEVHRFQGKYSIIFASTWGVISNLDTAVEAFGEIADNIWFNTPILQLDDPNKEEIYIQQIDIEQCNNYINSYERNFNVINRATGSLRGRMLGSITGVNLSFFISFLKMANKYIKPTV
jgi:hypothetical protein